MTSYHHRCTICLQALEMGSSIGFWMASSAICVLVIGAVVVLFDVRRILRVDPVTSTITG